uniref:Uncharacterized protein n=1 Tax=Meloidogyne hapla TaxID=6305 RepID=A0A1I8BSF3_MELHA
MQKRAENEAINYGIMHIIYAKELCTRINELYNEEDDRKLLRKFCKNFVTELADLILKYCGISYSLNNGEEEEMKEENLNDEKTLILYNNYS